MIVASRATEVDREGQTWNGAAAVYHALFRTPQFGLTATSLRDSSGAYLVVSDRTRLTRQLIPLHAFC